MLEILKYTIGHFGSEKTQNLLNPLIGGLKIRGKLEVFNPPFNPLIPYPPKSLRSKHPKLYLTKLSKTPLPRPLVAYFTRLASTIVEVQIDLFIYLFLCVFKF